MFSFFLRYGDHLDLHVLTHSFPTRRSSDLQRRTDGRFLLRSAPSHSNSCGAARAPAPPKHVGLGVSTCRSDARSWLSVLPCVRFAAVLGPERPGGSRNKLWQGERKSTRLNSSH